MNTPSPAPAPALYSARAFDAGGVLDAQRLRDIAAQAWAHGALHVQNTGLRSAQDLAPLLNALGLDRPFLLGGRTSAAHQPKWVIPGRIRRMDHYPAHLYLLPNNEVQYRRSAPARVLLYCQTPPSTGGRVLLHSAAALEAALCAHPVGAALAARLRRHGFTIETGFLDQDHPQKSQNYFQSWQERFQTTDPAAALAAAQSQRDEYDRCWWRHDDPTDPNNPNNPTPPTLMTRITRPGTQQHPDLPQAFLRFPRLAFDAPAPHNGFRRFPLGDGAELTDPERALLRQAFDDTAEGLPLAAGDLILFDNIRYAHSREPFEGPREVFVAMSHEVWEDTPPPPAPPPHPFAAYAQPHTEPHYKLPREVLSWDERFSMRALDAGGAMTPRACEAARAQLTRFGAVLVRNTGLRCDHAGALPDAVRRGLGFGEEDAFPWGGMSSGRTTRRALSPALRATDDYPRDLWLLPHNEVLYQRRMPARLLFFSADAGDPARGGRTFVHEAARLEAWIAGCGAPGLRLLDSLRAHGLLIEMGFVDDRHPQRASNYFRSWQERFGTDDRSEALSRCRAATLQFDEAWWREEPVEGQPPCFTLMTRIRLPAWGRDADGRQHLLFPRVALDDPALRNGYRRYPKGDGEPFTAQEIDLLLGGFLATREGLFYGRGDILLVDNLRYGHSRELFEGPRELGVAMAGEVSVEEWRGIDAERTP